MRYHLIIAVLTMVLTACSGSDHAPQPSSATDAGSSDGRTSTADRQANSAPDAAALAGLHGRRGELLNPDASTMVFLYYDLAGLTPPFDEWVERDMRVQSAPAIDKAARRASVRSELEAASRAVRDVGLIRVSMNADLSDYDPANAEFTVGALAPSSYLAFDAFGEKIAVNFANGRTAQIWSVPADQAQSIRDRIGPGRDVSIDALLRITAVQPRAGGGAVTTSVVEYDLRSGKSGPAIAHRSMTGT
ncbi:MAG: hypothetical protein KDI32_11380 [Pseudomonadales bacterium]|nr:hypothetical protein [Pseudomonadales bacterium]